MHPKDFSKTILLEEKDECALPADEGGTSDGRNLQLLVLFSSGDMCLTVKKMLLLNQSAAQ